VRINGSDEDVRNAKVAFESNMTRAFIGALEYQLPRIRSHDLRPAHASWLLRQGVHPKIVSGLFQAQQDRHHN